MDVVVDAPGPAELEGYREKCKNRWWRLQNLYSIKDETGKIVRFTPNWVQVAFLEAMWYFNIILKARQLGFTTLIDIFLLDVCLWNENVAAAIIADSEDKAKEIFDDKVAFAYDHLAAWVRAAVPLKQRSASSLEFLNGSSITVGVSIRGLTFQYLHISELGRIGKNFPKKAEEIKTGALNTVHAGQFIFIESTAEGQEGLFYELCDQAMKAEQEGRELTRLAFKMHFFPWFWDERYSLPPEEAAKVVIDAEHQKYFAEVEAEVGIELTDGQKAWYVEKERVQRDEMKQEYPSTAREAFEVSGEGKIYGKEMAIARREGRLLERVPALPDVPVHVAFDIGGASNRAGADYMSMWFIQKVGIENRLVHYHQASGRGIGYYVTYIKERGYVPGKIILPHDAKHKRLVLADAGKSVEDLFIDAGVPSRDIVIVDRLENKWLEGVGAVRNIFPTLVMDKTEAADGIRCLDNYKKVWNANAGAWRDQPAHDEWSHGADALETYARSDVCTKGVIIPGVGKKKRPKARSYKTV